MTSLVRLIACIRNGIQASRSFIYVEDTKIVQTFLSLLYRHDFIGGYKTVNKNHIKIFLKYDTKGSTIRVLNRMTKPSHPLYLSSAHLWKLRTSLGLVILSTPKGLVSHHTALRENLGGIVVCYLF